MQTGMIILAASVFVFLATVLIIKITYTYLLEKEMYGLATRIHETRLGEILGAIALISGIGIGVGFWWTIIGIIVRLCS